MWIKFAMENLKKNPKRIALTSAGVFIAVVLMTSSYAVIYSIEEQALEPWRDIIGGDAIITGGFSIAETEEGKYEPIYGTEEKFISISNTEDNSKASFDPFLLIPVIFFQEEENQGSITGRPQSSVEHFLTNNLVEGRLPSVTENKELEGVADITSSFVKNHQIKVGDSIKVLIPKIIDGRFSYEQGEVCDIKIVGMISWGGIISSDSVVVPYSHLAEICDLEKDKASYIAIHVKRPEYRNEIIEEVRKNTKYTVLTMDQLFSQMSKDFQELRSFIIKVLSSLFILSSLIVLNTMLVSVNERKREFAILRSIGMGSKDISEIILTETFLIICIGTGGGVFTGWLFISKFISGIWPILKTIFYIIFIVIVMALLGSIYPIYRAIKIHPMEVLKNE